MGFKRYSALFLIFLGLISFALLQSCDEKSVEDTVGNPASNPADDGTTATDPGTNPAVGQGTLTILLTEAFVDASADLTWAESNSNVLAAYVYSSSQVLVASVEPGAESISLDVDEGSYNVVLLAGDEDTTGDTYLLAAGIETGVDISADQDVSVSIGLQSAAFQVDASLDQLTETTTGGKMDINIYGILPTGALSVSGAPAVQVGDAVPVSMRITLNSTNWSATVKIDKPTTESNKTISFLSSPLVLDDNLIRNQTMNLDNRTWKLFLGENSDSYKRRYSFNLFFNDPAVYSVCAADTDNGCDFHTINEAIDSPLTDGLSILLYAGTYTEDVIINKKISLIGSGSGEDGTIITGEVTGSTHGVIQLEASGDSQLAPILFQNLRIAVDNMAGFSVGMHNDPSTDIHVSNIKLDNVTVIGTNAYPQTELERGFYVGPTASLSNLTVVDSSFDNMTYGWYLHKRYEPTDASPDQSNVSNITVTNTSFNHNFIKGIYAEKLSDAVFTDCLVQENGFTSVDIPNASPDRLTWLAGVDINLKSGIYQNISFINCTVTDNGHAFDLSGQGQASEGTGYAIKARDDGYYATFDATLDSVTIDGGLIANNERGIRIGEPVDGTADLNAGPTNVVIQNASIYDNTRTYLGVDGSAYGDLVNYTQSSVTATANFWNSASGAEFVYGDVDASSWFDTQDMVTESFNIKNVDSGLTYMTIQAAIDAAAAGEEIQVEPGVYNERIVINKSVILTGSANSAGVSKVGYPVPYVSGSYTWDLSNDTVINDPDPSSDGVVVDIVDTDSVTLDGFIIQSLNSRQSANTHLVRVYAKTVSLKDIKIENNLIGPNTNIDLQDGTYGGACLYLQLSPNPGLTITTSIFSGNKIFDCKGDGSNLLIISETTIVNANKGNFDRTFVEDNEITGGHRNGIEIAGSVEKLTFRKNLIYQNGGLENDISSDVRYGNGFALVRLENELNLATGKGPANLSITGNDIYENQKNGLYLGPINSGHTISTNNIYNNGWDAFRLDLNEDFYPGSIDVSSDISTIDLSARNNLLATPPNYGARVLGSPATGTLLNAKRNWWGDALGARLSEDASGDGSLVSDPVDSSQASSRMN